MTFKEFVDKQKWIFAKTYAKKAPHEYIVRGQIDGTDDEFMNAVAYIQEYGQTMYYWNMPNKYIYIDGRYYWVMTDNMEIRENKTILDLSDPTIIINRSNAIEYFVSIKWKGLPK